MTKKRMQATLDYLELVLASDFSERVTAHLRRLSDNEINTLWLMTHTGPMMGEPVHRWMAALLPQIDHEAELRRFVDMFPEFGPVLLPERFPRTARPATAPAYAGASQEISR